LGLFTKGTKAGEGGISENGQGIKGVELILRDKGKTHFLLGVNAGRKRLQSKRLGHGVRSSTLGKKRELRLGESRETKKKGLG